MPPMRERIGSTEPSGELAHRLFPSVVAAELTARPRRTPVW
jgi:hypothetical protein